MYASPRTSLGFKSGEDWELAREALSFQMDWTCMTLGCWFDGARRASVSLQVTG